MAMIFFAHNNEHWSKLLLQKIPKKTSKSNLSDLLIRCVNIVKIQSIFLKILIEINYQERLSEYIDVIQ